MISMLHNQLWQLSCILLTINIMTKCLALSETSGSDLDDRCNRTVEIFQSISGPPVTEFNRGKALHCTYRIRIRPQRDDWIVFVRFTRMRVGEPSHDRQKCIGGYIQVVDGYRETNHSNKDYSGENRVEFHKSYYCGEIDTPKTFISETPYVKVVFHVDSYQIDSYIQFDANVEQQNSVNSRYGQFHQLYPHRRGVAIAGTYCEKNYPDCSPGPRCTLQSPGFPGIYGRNLRCRYHLNAKQSFVGLELSAFDVDGQACDNLLMCFPRPVSTKQSECPYDYVRIYDGSDHNSPIIATLCGKGRIKSSIISSTSNMLVEFVTSPAGPLLSTGFHFKADAIIDTGSSESMQLSNGSCVLERELSSESSGGNVFAHIRSWYPPNTTCLYKLRARDTKDLISLEFLWFRIERVSLCQESVRIFDGNDADMSALITRLCDMNRPQNGNIRTKFVSSGPALTIQFSSLIGSFDGSSLNYAFEVKLIHPQNDPDLNDLSKSCSKHITPDSLTSGSVTWNYDEFNRSETQTQSTAIVCNISFDASSLQHGRVNVSIVSLFMVTNCKQCNESMGQPIVLIYRSTDRTHPKYSEPLCYCQLSRTANTSYVLSIGAQMIISLQLPTEWGAQHRSNHYSAPIQVNYRFFSDTRCGPNEIITPRLQGELHFPFSADPNFDNNLIKTSFLKESINSLSFDAMNDPVFCLWKLPLFPQLDIAFSIGHNLNCTTDSLVLRDIQVCPMRPSLHSLSSVSKEQKQTKKNSNHRRDIIIKSEDISSQQRQSGSVNSYSSSVITIYYTSRAPAHNPFLLLKYTQLKLLLPITSADQLVPMGRNCEFLCTNPPACLKQELVCNGVANCPVIGSGYRVSEDEDETLCKRSYLWSVLMKESTLLLVMGASGFLMLCCITFISICLCKRLKKKRHRF